LQEERDRLIRVAIELSGNDPQLEELDKRDKEILAQMAMLQNKLNNSSG
jgi:flagellar basal body-associated protein FliL